MRVHLLAMLALASAVAVAQDQPAKPAQAPQDQITLSNGDVVTGTIKTMQGGKLTIASPALGDVEVPMGQVANIRTAEPVELLTVSGDRIKRRIAGIRDGQVQFEGQGSEALGNLEAINPPDEAQWSGAFKLGAAWSSGNTDRRSAAALFDAELRRPDDRLTADASWDYAEDKPQGSGDWNLTQRRAGAGLKYDRFITEKLYWLVSTRALGDTLADIELRYTIGVGLGNQFIDDDTTSLHGEAGVVYFNESYRSATPSTDYVAARLAYKLRHEFTEKTRLIHGVEAFPSLESADDVYFQMNTEAQTNLTESMIGSLVWIWDYDNTPAPGRERSDHRVLLTVGWTF
jgi:putative salt-induced outer membrane protein YdiY